MPRTIHVIDSHTAGEPTRLIVEGGPDLGVGTVATKLERFRAQHDAFRSAVVNEPRGSDVLVGALLCEPSDRTCAAGVIFFNNVGYLGMCGHGTIGLVATLAHMGRLRPGTHRIETSVGIVAATLHLSGEVSVENIPSHRAVKAAAVNVAGHGKVTGDVAWSGNWFYLVEDHGQSLSLSNIEALTDLSWRIRQAVNAQGHPEVDHVELFAPAAAGGEGVERTAFTSGASAAGHHPVGMAPANRADSRSFVLCPGKAYDRSPCGTGTSAKLACLAADGKLAPGETWVQESIVGTRFTASYRWHDQAIGSIIPTITGSAFVNAESRLLLDDRDPFCWGIRGSVT